MDKYIEAFLLLHKNTKGKAKANILSDHSHDRVPIREHHLSGFNTGKYPSGKTYERICLAAKDFFIKNYPDPEGFIKSLRPSYSGYGDVGMQYERIHAALEGFWILVHISSIHFEALNREPKLRYRVAIIVYQNIENENRSTLNFHLFGRNTVFQGSAHQKVNKIYLGAQEIRRKEEEMLLILNRPASRENVWTNAGVITGVGFGEYNAEGNIYASKCLARKINVDQHGEKILAESLADDESRKSICAYYEEEQVLERSILSSIISDQILETIFNFKSRFSGDALRLYVY